MAAFGKSFYFRLYSNILLQSHYQFGFKILLEIPWIKGCFEQLSEMSVFVCNENLGFVLTENHLSIPCIT